MEEDKPIIEQTEKNENTVSNDPPFYKDAKKRHAKLFEIYASLFRRQRIQEM